MAKRRRLKAAERDSLGLLGFAAAVALSVALVAPIIRKKKVTSTIYVGPPSIG